MNKALGIDIGSTNLKLCVTTADNKVESNKIVAHNGNWRDALSKHLQDFENLPTVVTGQEGRLQVNIKNVIEVEALTKALKYINVPIKAIAALGGENFVVHKVNEDNQIIDTHAGSKCAAGTGEFFTQQLMRMNLTLNDVNLSEVSDAKISKLSSRCSVFMKSDCTHKLNKGEATRYDLVLGLSYVMASKVIEFLGKAKVESGNVLLIGGITRNTHVLKYLQEGMPNVTFIVPPQAEYFEAYGASLLARDEGMLINPANLFTKGKQIYKQGKDLILATSLVTYITPKYGEVKNQGEYILGVDGGSTTTKVALIDISTLEIVASHYGRTLGNPVNALKECLVEVKKQLAAKNLTVNDINIKLVATTGSSRELLGTYLGTSAIYNEIMAHSYGSTHFDKDIDTIFEIGGQDAKYVSLLNGVPVDYAMNEACSAGTGSFLEESAAGDLNIHNAEDIGPVALTANAPLLFGEHCSAFINSDIRKAIQLGSNLPDIVAGLVLSIVSNYLNRVVGNRKIGNHIVLQGGVAKNPAIPLAFASLLNKKIIIPASPELMGCFGVALLAMEKVGSSQKFSNYNIDEILTREIQVAREFKCHACENLCPIKIIKVGEASYNFGGRCNKYSNKALNSLAHNSSATDYVNIRKEMLFNEFAGNTHIEGAKTIAVPETFSIYSLWPLYSNFLNSLGFNLKIYNTPTANPSLKCESSFCYPGELAHGIMENLLNDKGNFDYIFLPHFKTMPSYQSDIHACICPITQALPYYLEKAFDLKNLKILSPVVNADAGLNISGLDTFIDLAITLGKSKEEGITALTNAINKQKAFYKKGREIGKLAIKEAEEKQEALVVLSGRPYNAFTGNANLGIPKKFLSRGISVLPFDFVPITDEEIFPNMYWYYGQQDLKSTTYIKNCKNVFVCYITNFSCAPDSFILHYLRWIHKNKPFLILELDSHSADAGVDTRIEAFLDIIEGYIQNIDTRLTNSVKFRFKTVFVGNDTFVLDTNTGNKLTLRDKQVKLLFPCMGNLATNLLVSVLKGYGIDAVVLPDPHSGTAALARTVASGKECVPALHVLGSFMEYAKKGLDPNTAYLLFMPITTGPCRTGQYAIYYQKLFEELNMENVITLSLNSDNSYSELGAGVTKRAWISFCLSDYMRDIELAINALATDKAAALANYHTVCLEMCHVLEHDFKNLFTHLPKWAKSLSTSLIQNVEAAKKVLLIGEIFVRRDYSSVQTFADIMATRNIVVKITGLSEWVHYLDYQQMKLASIKLKKMNIFKRLFSKELKLLIKVKIESLWKIYQEKRIVQALNFSNLLAKGPHGMKSIMSNAALFTSPDLESEATLSPCSAKVAMEEGYSGVAIISPFACLPGRLIEATYAPWARIHKYPVLAFECDGNPYPPTLVNKFEIFAYNVANYNNPTSAETSNIVDTNMLRTIQKETLDTKNP